MGDADEASRDPGGVAFQTKLPDAIDLIIFRNGIVVFNFSENNTYCGGSMPVLDVGPINPNYETASEKRLKIASARTNYMNVFIAMLEDRRQVMALVFNLQSILIVTFLLN